jgi:hypothetical protein
MVLRFKEQLRLAFQPGRACQVRKGFRKRLQQLLRAPELLRGLLLFLHLRAAVVPHPDREAVSPRGEGAAAAAEAQQVRLLDRRDTRHPRVAAEADTRTNSQSLGKNHSCVTHHRVPVSVHVTGSRITHDFAALHAEFLHRREHSHRGPQSAHGNFLLAADFE